MSHPNVIYGDYGDEKVAQSSKIGDIPLGTLMILADGRKFRAAQAGAAALSAGAVLACSAGAPGYGNLAGSGLKASATVTHNLAEATDVHVATSLLALTKDLFADGVLNIVGPAASTYIGHMYKVKGNEAAASVGVGGAATIHLYETDPLKVALAPTSCVVSLKKSPYKDMIIYAPNAIIAPPMGVAPVAVSASFYFWCQRSGEASVRQGATVCVVGMQVVNDLTEAGSVALALTAAGSTGRGDVMGYALEGQSASQAIAIYMTLE